MIRFGGDLESSQAFTNNVSRLSGAGSEIVFEVNAPTGLAGTSTEMYVASQADGTILQLAADAALLDAPLVIAEGLEAPEGLAVLPDGGLVVVETGSGNVTRIDIATARPLSRPKGPARPTPWPTSTRRHAQQHRGGTRAANTYVTSPADGNVSRVLAS